MDRKAVWGDGVFTFVDELLEGDLHGKRVLSLANATLGVMVSASLAVAVIGRSLAQARGLLTKHAVKQVDRLLSNQAIDPWEFLERLMTDHPDAFTPGQIRTVQRRLKDWRSDVAHKLVFGDGELATDVVPIEQQITSPARTVS